MAAVTSKSAAAVFIGPPSGDYGGVAKHSRKPSDSKRGNEVARACSPARLDVGASAPLVQQHHVRLGEKNWSREGAPSISRPLRNGWVTGSSPPPAAVYYSMNP